jgi:hypothetical protein
MSEPQLSVRSTRARDLAHALSRKTGQPINRLVEIALEHYDAELRTRTGKSPAETLFELMDQGRTTVLPDTTSYHGDFYDENGLPA